MLDSYVRIKQTLTALSGSPWKNLRSASSRYCLQSGHLGGGAWKNKHEVASSFKQDVYLYSKPVQTCYTHRQYGWAAWVFHFGKDFSWDATGWWWRSEGGILKMEGEISGDLTLAGATGLASVVDSLKTGLWRWQETSQSGFTVLKQSTHNNNNKIQTVNQTLLFISFQFQTLFFMDLQSKHESLIHTHFYVQKSQVTMREEK